MDTTGPFNERARPRERRIQRRRPRGEPTPIPVSRRTWNLLVAGGAALLVLLLWAVPTIPAVSLAGFAVALVLSLPARLLARAMPRSAAIALSFLIGLALLLLAAYVVVPLLIAQVGGLIAALPELLQNMERALVRALRALDRRDLLPDRPEAVAARLTADLRDSLGVITDNVVGRTVGFVFGTVSWALTLFAVIFVAASLLANARPFKAAYLASVPARYRHDALDLWDALGRALTRYLGGLGLVLAIQGALSAAALFLIGVPYPLALGAWVSITAVVPYLGAWIGAIPALLVAASISPGTAALTAALFLAIQQLEGNVLTPRIQAQTIKVPSILVFLGVIAGGALAGLAGVLLAVPALATLRVVFDFLRARLRAGEATVRAPAREPCYRAPLGAGAGSAIMAGPASPLTSVETPSRPIHPGTRIGHVHLRVADLDRALGFYCGVLGFALMQRYGAQAAFVSAGGYHHHLGLNTWESLGGSPPPPGSTGLFHTAILYPTRPALADALRRLRDAGIPLDGASDHGVSEALYLRDPDQNGVELYWDRPPERWPRTPDGHLAMFTRHLDLDDLLREPRIDG